MVGIDTGPREQFRAGSGAGHTAHGEVGDDQVRLPGGEQSVGDGTAEPTLGVVVFGDHDAPGGGAGCRGESDDIDRFDRVAVDVISSSSETTPTALNTEYSSGDAWPLEKIR